MSKKCQISDLYIKRILLENSNCESGGTGLCEEMKQSDLVQLVHTAILKWITAPSNACAWLAKVQGGLNGSNKGF